MDVGTYTEQVSFRRISRVQRSDGGYDTTPVVVGTTWASVVPVAARESEQAGRLTGTTTYLIEVPYDAVPADLSTDDSIVWVTQGGDVLNVREIRRPSRQMMTLQIVALAGVTE